MLLSVKAENGRIAAAYNEDGFGLRELTPNLNRFIVLIDEDVRCGDRFDRNSRGGLGIINDPYAGPWFRCDLFISKNVTRMMNFIHSILGGSYGGDDGLYPVALFGKELFRVSDYEVFKIVIE
jgi:hypothetical protein